MHLYLIHSKVCLFLNETSFFILNLLIKKSQNQNLQKIEIVNEKIKKFKKYLNQIFIKIYKSVLRKKVLNYPKQTENKNLSMIDSSYISNVINTGYEDEEKNFTNTYEDTNFFMRGEIDCSQMNKNKMLQFDKENIYMKENNLKIIKEKEEDLKEIIKTHVSSIYKREKIVLCNQKDNLNEKKYQKQEFSIEKEKIKKNRNLLFSNKKKDKTITIKLLNRIFDNLNTFFQVPK